MGNTFNFDEFMERMKEELNTEIDFTDLLLDAAIATEKSDDKRLAFMIAKKAGEVVDIIVDTFTSADVILALEIEAKKNAFVYLTAVANGLKEFKKHILPNTPDCNGEEL